MHKEKFTTHIRASPGLRPGYALSCSIFHLPCKIHLSSENKPYYQRKIVPINYLFFAFSSSSIPYRWIGVLGFHQGYENTTWISFDYEGNVSVNISQKDYLKYKENLTFNQRFPVRNLLTTAKLHLKKVKEYQKTA